MTAIQEEPVARFPTILFRLALKGDIPAIEALIRAFGEGKVDLRSRKALLRAIRARELYVFEAEDGGVVAIGGCYSYCGGCLVELGTSVWVPEWRGLGGADVSVLLRSLLSVLAHPGSSCVSELYFDSKGSAKVLARNGFVEVQPTPSMERHAVEASERPVRHFALPPMHLPRVAAAVLSFLDAPFVRKGIETLRVRLAPNILIRQASGRAAVRALADGDLSVAGWALASPMDPAAAWAWLGHDGC